MSEEAASPRVDASLSQEALENLRSFFSILNEWDEEDSLLAAQSEPVRQERALETIAEDPNEDVELE